MAIRNLIDDLFIAQFPTIVNDDDVVLAGHRTRKLILQDGTLTNSTGNVSDFQPIQMDIGTIPHQKMQRL